MSNKSKFREPWQLVKAVADHARTLLLYGPPGTGKSFAAHGDGSRPVYSVTLTPDTPAAELRGHYVPVGGEFVWRDGPCTRAWREGARLVINEIDHAGGDALSYLLNCLDSSATARITLPSGETVRPADGFQCVATMNGKPDEDLPEALRDRFPVRVEITEPHPAGVDSLPPDLREAARATVCSPDPERRITLRAWLDFAKLRALAGEEAAAYAVFRHRAEDVMQSFKIAVSATDANS